MGHKTGSMDDRCARNVRKEYLMTDTPKAIKARRSGRQALEEVAPLLYSVPEAAARLRVAPKWLYERTRKNAVPYRRLGKYVRFSEEDLAAIVANAFTPTNGSITTKGGRLSDNERSQSYPEGANEDAAGAR